MEKYELDSTNGAYRRWRGPITPPMRALMNAVGAALDDGVSYNTDMNKRIAPLFDWGDAPPMPADGREGGVISYEIYSARQRLQAERDAAKEQVTFAALALQPKQKLGTLRLFGQRIRRVRNAVVTSAEPGKIALTASSGGKRYTLTMGAVSLQRALDIWTKDVA